jgi:hypothetical protein
MNRRVHVGKLPFVSRDLAVGVHVPFAQEQDQLLLGELDIQRANGTIWNALSQAAYQGYSHLSGIEMMSRLNRCFQSELRPFLRASSSAGQAGSPSAMSKRRNDKTAWSTAARRMPGA